MPLRISNLRLSIDEPESALPAPSGARARHSAGRARPWRILRKSLDARTKDALHFVYTAEIATPEDEDRLLAAGGVSIATCASIATPNPRFRLPPPGTTPLPHRPVVVGSGPAGLVAGYFLAAAGLSAAGAGTRPGGARAHPRRACLRRRRRRSNPESNYLFGEGGAGTFSDGKLTCRVSGPDVRRVLELFAECKGKPSILYDYRPHLGSNRLPAVVKAIRRRIEALGGEVRFDCRVEDLDICRTAGCAAWPRRRATSPPTWCCWRSATAPATPSPCWCAAACRWCPSRSRWACASSSRRRSSTASSTARPVWKPSSARPTTPWWRTARTTCSPSACAPAGTSSRAFRRRAISAPTA